MISVIIPTLNAEKYIGKQIELLDKQTIIPDEIIVVDSESDDRTAEIVSGFSKVTFLSIKREEFNHGGTRNMAFNESHGDFVLFLTQDALPYDDMLIENLLKAFDDPKVAVANGRQVAKESASLMERYVREFNYPDKSAIKSAEDKEELGIKTFYCSDVCNMYRKTAFEELGGFISPVRANEDMFFGATAINAGYKIAYVSEAKVRHSHSYSLKKQYERNKNLFYEIEKHKDILDGVSANSEGIKLVKNVVGKLIKGCHFILIIKFGFDCIARYSGSKAGRKEFHEQINNG